MQYHRGLERRTGRRRAIGPFEINAIAEGHAIERVHFSGQECGGGAIENAAAIQEIGGVDRILPQRLLRNVGRQGVEPGALAVTTSGKSREVGPMDVVLVVFAGSTSSAVSDAEIWKDLIVVIQIHVKRKTPLLGLRFLRHAIRLAFSFAFASAGKSIAARMAMMVMTTRSSISVNPCFIS